MTGQWAQGKKIRSERDGGPKPMLRPMLGISTEYAELLSSELKICFKHELALAASSILRSNVIGYQSTQPEPGQ